LVLALAEQPNKKVMSWCFTIPFHLEKSWWYGLSYRKLLLPCHKKKAGDMDCLTEKNDCFRATSKMHQAMYRRNSHCPIPNNVVCFLLTLFGFNLGSTFRKLRVAYKTWKEGLECTGCMTVHPLTWANQNYFCYLGLKKCSL
jgi:hypothetical protein